MMGNTGFKKILGFITAAAIIIMIIPAAVSAQYDEPSPWAELEVFMAYTAYNIGEESTYSDFRSGVTGEKFEAVYKSIAAAFGKALIFNIENDGYLTRGEIVAALGGLIIIVQGEETAPVPTVDEALAYFISNRLINGRASGDYQLDSVCTVEEMILFSVRVYEHISRLTGDYSAGFLWQVHGGESIVYLFGSVHFSDGSLYPFSPAIESAFLASENLVVEINISELTEEQLEYFMQKGIISDGTTIADYLAPDIYELYADIWQVFGVPAEIYDYFQPWLAANELRAVAIALGLGAELQDIQALGVDMYFMIRADAMGKNIMELETVESQIDMMASYSPELQESQLHDVLMMFISREEDAGEEFSFAAMLAAFKSGDEEALSVFLGAGAEPDDPLEIELLDKLLTQRDIAMAATIAELLEDGDNGGYFIIIGAAHFMGDESILVLLEEMGYKIERIK